MPRNTSASGGGSRDSHSRIAIIDLTQSSPSPSPPSLVVRSRRSIDGVPLLETTHNAPSPSTGGDGHLKGRSPGSTPRRPRDHQSVGTMSPSLLAKASPNSTKPPTLEAPQLVRQRSSRSSHVSTPNVASVDSDIISMTDNSRQSPRTPPKRASRDHVNSQKSVGDFPPLGTDSPIYVRHMEKKAAKLTTRDIRRPTVAGLKESLREFKQRMKDDHALTVRWLLHDAMAAEESRPTLFVDSVSPFASMTGVQLNGSKNAPDGTSTVRMNHFVAHKPNKISKTTSILIAKHITDDLPRVPKYTSYTNVKRNILSADDEKLKFLPYVRDVQGDPKKEAEFNRMVRELENLHNNKPAAISKMDLEEALLLRNYLPAWLEELNIGCDLPTLKRYILIVDRNANDLDLRASNRELLIEFFGGALSREAESATRMFVDAFYHIFGWAAGDIVLPKEGMEEVIETAKKTLRPKVAQPSDRNETYSSLTCLICGAVDCPTHGDYSQNDISASDDSDGGDAGIGEQLYDIEHLKLILPYADMVRRFNIRKVETGFDHGEVAHDGAPCSEDCYRNVGFNNSYSWPSPVREDFLAALPGMLTSQPDDNHRSCNVGFCWSLPCWQVHAEFQKYQQNNDTSMDAEEMVPTGHPKRPDWYDNKRRTLKGDWTDFTRANIHQERAQALACGHPGPCTGQCPCFQGNILCERYCGCPDDCPRKFTGCPCASNGVTCVSESCICIQMNRECGPECDTCGALERIHPANKYNDDLFKTGCQNVYLQRGVSKVLLMGESQLEGAGFGLYTGEPIRKGEFLSEYAGEVITFTEADRRGIIYDNKLSSFLFDLNREYVIDAARLGNKTRFINHAFTQADGMNCEAKILLVNGEHRIKFLASRDIDVGEELLFNYGKGFAEKHGLSKKMPKGKVAKGKVALIDENANASNAADKSKRGGGKGKAKMGKGTAITTTSGNGHIVKQIKGTKMRKTAAQIDLPELLREGEASEYSTPPSEDEEEETEHEAGANNVRSARKIVRPARYTR